MAMETRLGLVIGGGNGIGESCCRVMERRGWRVLVADLDEKGALRVAREVGGSGYALDISELAAVENLSAQIEAEHGIVDGLVVASGAFQEKYEPDAFPMDLWRKITKVNLEGTFNANRVFGSAMVRARRGSIVNIASILAQDSSPQHAYGPTKAAVVNLSMNLAAQWGPSGVRVNSLSPGATIVPRVQARGVGRYAADLGKEMALGRCVEANEVAEGVEFLLSDRASAITGVDLRVDAGWRVAAAWHIYGGIPEAPAGAAC